MTKDMHKPTNKEELWKSTGELATALQQAYSVTGKEAILQQYLVQVQQYPLYQQWFELIAAELKQKLEPIQILEYGCGPGFLVEIALKNQKIENYFVVEPEPLFIELTKERIKESIEKEKVTFIQDYAENYRNNSRFDLIVATATYHHFSDKLGALRNIYDNLREGGKIIFGEVFLPNYVYDENYCPKDKVEFLEKVIEYAATQIKSMPSPSIADISDQIKTAFLDILRVEELKVSVSIILDQLKGVGFRNINCKLISGDKPEYDRLGYYLITGEK